jgi:hypothetical protein
MGIVRQTAVSMYDGLYVDDAEPARDVTSVQSVTGDSVGQAVCKVGFKTGRTCGQVTMIDATIIDSNNKYLYHMREASFGTDHGDSGGAVYYCGLSTCNARGIIEGVPVVNGQEDHTHGFYSHIGNITGPLGLRVCTDSSPC